MRKNIIVFGGGGFIGSYVVEELIQRKYHVIYTDIKPNHNLPKNIYKECNIMSKKDILEILKERVDIVYNFAGFANLDDSVNHPTETFELNVLGNINILEAIKSKNIERFIYASSAYAMSIKGSFYGISKFTSEKIIEEYNRLHGLDYTIIRYGSVYSERPSDNNYIYNLIKQAITLKKIDHHGDGDEIREYIHASDVARLSTDILEDPQYINQHIILTGVEKMKRIDLFNMIKEILHNEDIKIELAASGYKNHYKFTPYNYHPALSKKLVANPYIDMGQGLLACIKSIKEGIEQ